MTHFEVIFVKGVSFVSRLTVFSYGLPIVPVPFLKSYPLFIELPLLLCQISVDCIYVDPFWALFSVLLTFVSILSLGPHCLDYSRFIVTLDVR